MEDQQPSSSTSTCTTTNNDCTTNEETLLLHQTPELSTSNHNSDTIPAGVAAAATTDQPKLKNNHGWDGYHEHVAKIRPEFRRDTFPIPITSEDSNTTANTTNSSNNNNNKTSSNIPAKSSGFHKRTKFMKTNKGTDNNNSTNTNEIKYCNLALRGNTCPYGNQCMFSHDMKSYLLSRPDDIPGPCPIFTMTEKCPMGYACRWVGSHLDTNTFLLTASTDGGSANNDAVTTTTDNTNNLSFNSIPIITTTTISTAINNNNNEQDMNPTTDITTTATTTTPTNKHFADIRTALQRKTYQFLGTHKREGYVGGRRPFSLQGKIYVAPLTTVGNLPFRRLLVKLGADVTCGEMTMAYQICRGSSQEWALLKRHPSEKYFGVQIAGCGVEELAQAAEIISRETEADFIDINMGCPIDAIVNHGAGSALLKRPARIEQIVEAVVKTAPDVPLGLKLRTGWEDDKFVAHDIITRLRPYAENLLYMTVHGRTRAQRYTKTANWKYITTECAQAAKDVHVPLLGNGDVMSWVDYHNAITPLDQGGFMNPDTPLVGALIGRGALIKPWICTEVREKRDWDISANERFDLLKEYCYFGLDHWGSDSRGVETTRRYALEWMSFSHRYVPIGLCEQGYRQHMNDRPPFYVGRSELETLLGSPNSKHWEQLVNMILGPPPEGFQFVPKHKANAW
jgi:tRNA-dihydrouridine synthase 3